MLQLVSDTDRASAYALPADAPDALRKAIHLADKGMWSLRIRMPDGRRLTVNSIIRTFGLQRFVRPDLNPPDKETL